MVEHPSKPPSEDKKTTVTSFLLKTILWIIPAFFFWYIGATLFCYPAIFLSDVILPLILPGIMAGLEHSANGMANVVTLLKVGGSEGQVGQLVFSMNTLKYAYGFPLLFAMTLATNRSSYAKMDTLTYGFIIIILAQTWSICFEVLTTLLTKTGDDNFNQITQAFPFYADPFVSNGIALGYQLGFLILPAVVPIIFWVFQHQSFLKQISSQKG